ncbi:MAG: hypothetical protein WCV93_02040 [Candidatus Shapirobacteria bacterium]|jgi:hypothetical protein
MNGLIEGRDGGSCGGYTDQLIGGARINGLRLGDSLSVLGDGGGLARIRGDLMFDILAGHRGFGKTEEIKRNVTEGEAKWLAVLAETLDLVMGRVSGETIFLASQRTVGGDKEIGLEVGWVGGSLNLLLMRSGRSVGGVVAKVDSENSVSFGTTNGSGMMVDWDLRVWEVVKQLLPEATGNDAQAIVRRGARSESYVWSDLRDKMIRWQDFDGYPWSDVFGVMRYGNEFVGSRFGVGCGVKKTKISDLSLRVN